jgi:hypothetical protein
MAVGRVGGWSRRHGATSSRARAQDGARRAADEETRLGQPPLGDGGPAPRPVRSELAATGEPWGRDQPPTRSTAIAPARAVTFVNRSG